MQSKRNPVHGLDPSILKKLESAASADSNFSLGKLFALLSELSDTAEKPIVLIIDEIDNATNNQVFLDFLAQLRAYYLKRTVLPTFHSVILAGVYDVKNTKRKIRPDEEHNVNSPWNIASDFNVTMSFSEGEIAGMLRDYEADCHTDMNIGEISGLIYAYTSGYPFLVSRLCKLMDEKVAGCAEFPDRAAAWTKGGFLEAVKQLLSEKNTLFESLMEKLLDYPSLEKKLYSVLFSGDNIVFSPFDASIDMALMFGFVKKSDGMIVIANRIFETILYDYFLTAGDSQQNGIFRAAAQNKNQFIRSGHLDMELVLKK